MIPEENPKQSLVELSIVLTQKNNGPQIELRKAISNTDMIKTIISCAFHNRPIIVQPHFRDRTRALGTLQEKGIIYRDSEKEEYFFNI